MGIQVSCSKCNKKYSIKDSLAGKKIKCPGCGEVLTVPMPSVAAGSSKANQPLFEFADEAGEGGLVCAECGADLPSGTKVCINCGFHLGEGAKIATLDVDKYLDSLHKKKVPGITRPWIVYLLAGVFGAGAVALFVAGSVLKGVAKEPSYTHTMMMAGGGVLVLIDLLYYTGRLVALKIVRFVYVGTCFYCFFKTLLSFAGNPAMIAVYLPAFFGVGFLVLMTFNPLNDDFCTV